MIVAGVGCRRGTPATAITAAIDATLARAGLSRSRLDAIAAPIGKIAEPGVAASAAALGVSLVPVEQAALESAADRTVTCSARVMALTGVPSVAEAAALAAAGPTAHLLVPRVVVDGATCALAATGGAS